MKKSYRFNFIPGVEFIEENGFYYTASDDPLWPKASITMVIIEGLAQYERVNDELETKLKNSEFTISVLNDRISSLEATLKQKDKEIEEHKNAVSVLQGIIESTKETAKNERKHRDGLIKEKDKEIEALTKKLKNAKRNCSYLDDKIKYLRECGGKEINHRDNIITEKDEEIDYLRGKLHEEILKSEAYKDANKTLKKENTNLIDQIAKSPISKSPIPLSSASDCYDLYICTPDHITYGYIAGEFGVGLYVGDTLILLKGDKASEVVRERSSMTDRINILETTLKKRDETIRKLRNTAEFTNNICDGYGALTDTLMSSIEAKNSEIKVLSDQVTRLMDQLKEATEGNSGCESCCDICGNTDCEHRVETEAKSETNLDKLMHDMFISALDTWLKENPDTSQRVATEAKPKTNFDKILNIVHQKLSPAKLTDMIDKYDCRDARCNECPFNIIAAPYNLTLCDMSRAASIAWLGEDIKED